MNLDLRIWQDLYQLEERHIICKQDISGERLELHRQAETRYPITVLLDDPVSCAAFADLHTSESDLGNTWLVGNLKQRQVQTI